MNLKLVQLLEEKETIEKSYCGINNPRIAEIWKELGKVVGQNLLEVKESIDSLSEKQVHHLSEAFEDIAENLQDKKIIEYFKSLEEKFPQLDLSVDILATEDMIKKKK